MAALADRLEWDPYILRGARSRVLDHITSGGEEFELCAEGGQHVIRRTVYSGGEVVRRQETARGRVNDAAEVWGALKVMSRRRGGW